MSAFNRSVLYFLFTAFVLRPGVANAQTFEFQQYIITYVAEAGSFLLSAMSIYLGYKLFVLGAKGEFKFEASVGQGKVGVASVAPGIGFAVFGMALACFTVWHVIR